MAVWAVIIPAEQWATERLFHNETVTVPGAARTAAAGTARGGAGTAPGGAGTASGGAGTASGGAGTASGGAGTAPGGAGTELGGASTAPGAVGVVAPDEEVLLVADDHVVALARAAKADDDDLVLTYLRRAFDDPVPATGLIAAGGGPVLTVPGGGPVQVEPQAFRRLAAALGAEPGPGTPTWLVSLALPIEAATPADAVRQFWTHLVELGPRELPVYVWPSGDELAMQAFVLGEEANQDPEEDDED